MHGMPIVKIQLQDMAYEIAHAFGNRQLELTGAVEDALKRAVETFDFEGEVRKVAHQVLTESVKGAVQSAVWKAFNWEARHEVIVPIVRQALQEALREQAE